MGQTKLKRQRAALAAGRVCGDCQLCCELVPVRELNKPANERCQHQGSGGCAVHHREGFPASCGGWNCLWLDAELGPTAERPDIAGYCVDPTPDLIRLRDNATGKIAHTLAALQVWCDPKRRDAWRDPALLDFVERLYRLSNIRVMLVRYSSTEAMAIVRRDEGWVRHDGKEEVVASRTGNLLLDALKVDTSDIPEATEEWFKRAKLRRPSYAR